TLTWSRTGPMASSSLRHEMASRWREEQMKIAVIGAGRVGSTVGRLWHAAGPIDGRVMIDAANSFGQEQVTLRSLADAFPRARWVRAFNSLSASIMADDNHRKPPWVLFLSGDEEAKPVVAQLIRDAGFDPFDLGGIGDSRLQDPD